MNNDKGNIGIITNERIDELAKSTYKSLDKLEQRISTLEKSIGHLTKRYAEVRQHLEGDNNEQS